MLNQKALLDNKSNNDYEQEESIYYLTEEHDFKSQNNGPVLTYVSDMMGRDDDSFIRILDTSTQVLTNLSQDSHFKGFFYMNLFCMSQTGLNIIQKWLIPQGVTLSAFTLYRNATNFTVIATLVYLSGRRPFTDFPRSLRGTMVLRSIFGTIGFIGMAYNLTLLPMAVIMIIYQTNPFWNSLLSYWVNGDPVQKVEIVAMIICFIGVVIIATSKLGQDFSLTDTSLGDTTVAMQVGGGILAFGLAWQFAIVGTLNRKMKDLHFTVIMYNHTLLGMFIAVIWLTISALVSQEIPLLYSAHQYWLIGAACVCDVISVNSLTIAYQADKAAFVSLVGQLNIVYAFTADYFIFDQVPSSLEIKGAAMIVCVTLFIGILKLRKS
eukprot:CAMPEP_0176395482 /NCGR_PEP_ID=MMETSP0126-20121128/43443_1 /TAXON_ID=141414 ORGANISM="Strombidinopsis acuminatum, Strain SPMC142" /NCGR_SAMPLE_ID=MMETSP0126 /ASSEMBLY_ACC=CAM_ASM_000229 /LENGTH=378 /DNA_ID=CAMNT_0017768385 /DNA_START=27 /DNA_END=1163 /DNA_ORIENTATION=+